MGDALKSAVEDFGNTVLSFEEFKTIVEGEHAAIDGSIFDFEGIDEIDYWNLIVKHELRSGGMYAPKVYQKILSTNLGPQLMHKLTSSRTKKGLRTTDLSIYGVKGMGKSLLMLRFMENYYNFFNEPFFWEGFFFSPAQFLQYSEEVDVEKITKKVLGIDEPAVEERGAGSLTMWDRFMDTLSLIHI